LAGKVVANLGGGPLLAFMLGRLRRLPVDNLVVATSDHARDDVVGEVAAAAGADVVRGPSRTCSPALCLPSTRIRLTWSCASPLTVLSWTLTSSRRPSAFFAARAATMRRTRWCARF